MKSRSRKKSTAKKKRAPAKKIPARKAAKKVGRPRTTGAGTPMVVRMHDDQIKALDKWIDGSGISRPEAIRQLVTFALGQHVQKNAAANGADLQAAG